MKSNAALKITALLFSIIFFVACNNPLNRTYQFSTYEEDLQEIRKTGKADEEDLQLLTKYILLSRLSGNDFSGQTYKSLLEKIKSTQQKNVDASTRDAMEKESRRQRLSAYLQVNLLNKEFSNIKNEEVLIYTVTLKNNSSQKIKTITGNLSINDLLEKPIKQLNVFIDKDIKPGQTFTKIDTIPYTNADINDQRMRSKALVDMRVVWNPEKIILENGILLQ